MAMTLAERLAAELTRKDLSQREAADLVGVTQAAFSRWVIGDNIPTSKHWPAIADFLGISRDEVIELVVQAKGSPKPRNVEERFDNLERQIELINAQLDLLTLAWAEQQRRADPES